MRVYKFGGASVQDAKGIRNVLKVLQTMGTDDLGLVVSAMGKTTNALERVIEAYQNDQTDFLKLIDQLHEQHNQIIEALEQPATGIEDAYLISFRESNIKKEIASIIESLKGELLRNKSKNYSFLYDQVVSHGELLSTRIIAAFLNACDVPVIWKDARQLIRTNNKYRDAAVEWEESEQRIKAACAKQFFITQGFIGSEENGLTTTLGREGSDYTAAILAYCLDAESVTIWKDVPGVLNGDPRVFQDTLLLETIPYSEAIELAFYGASVIHPKTLQPLQGKEIPLHVKSFLNPTDKGTVITSAPDIFPTTPCFIVRKNLIFLKISARDFSFIGEHNISDIFHELSTHKMQVGLLQNSAISFSLCIEDKYAKIKELIKDLETKYKVQHVEGVSLYTVRHYDDASMKMLEAGKETLLKQRTQETLQLIVQE